MTAAESYAERRGEFATLAEDQLINGVIKVDQLEQETVDPITGDTTTIKVVTPRTCGEDNGTTCVGGRERDLGVFREFGISLTNFVIDGIKYPDNVLAQIEAQRKARMNIITQEAEAKEAEARAKKAKSEAEAAVAETRAKEEIAKTQRIVKAEADKAEAVLQAEKVKDVARLEKEAAEFTKKKEILLGEGEATRKRLVMQADGALEKKLAAWVKAQEAYAKALGTAQPGALVPSLQMGTSGGKSGSAQDFINLLTAGAAKDLSLDLKVKGSTK
jgi:regulator of protease activity HflC (stomatin/prohibitin superfamily)